MNKIKNFNKLSPVAKTSIALIVANFMQKGLAFISNPIFTRIMPSSEYGIISTFTSWQNVLAIVATLNLSSGVFNNGMIDFKEDRDGFVLSICFLSNLSTMLCTIIYFIFYKWINPFIDMPHVLLVVMLLYFIFYPSYSYWMGRSRFEYRYKPILIVSIVMSVLSTLLSIAFVVLAPDNSKSIAKILGSESVAIIAGIGFYIFFFIKGNKTIKFEYWKYALKINIPLLPHYLSMYVLASSDRIMITKLVNTSATAIYSLAYTVASVVLIFWNSVDAAYAPWIYQKMESKDYRSLDKRAFQVIVLFAFVSIFATLFAPEIIYILGPSEYYEGAYVIPSVVCGVYFTAVFSLYMRIELYLKKTVAIMWATIAAAIMNLVLNYWFIPMLGFVAAGYTTLCCYFLLTIFHMLNLKRFGYGNVYNARRILLISFAVILIILPISLIYNMNFLRYFIIISLGIVGFMKRKPIINLLKNH